MRLNRKDNLKLREKILSITNEEIKMLGINKSTLWYLKKGLKSGKKPRIYKKVLERLDTSFV